MNLALLGGSGRTGKYMIEQALDAGHHVKALVRTPSKITIHHPRLTLLQGDATDSASIDQLVRDVDVVISVLGHADNRPSDMQTVAAQHLVAAMKQHGVKRIISLTGGGVRDPNDQPRWIDHVFGLLLRLFSANVLADAENHARVLRQSGLEWILVRGPRLTEEPFTGRYRVGYVGVNSGTSVSRADLAHFILQQLTDSTYVGKSPMISA